MPDLRKLQGVMSNPSQTEPYRPGRTRPLRPITGVATCEGPDAHCHVSEVGSAVRFAGGAPPIAAGPSVNQAIERCGESFSEPLLLATPGEWDELVVQQPEAGRANRSLDQVEHVLLHEHHAVRSQGLGYRDCL